MYGSRHTPEYVVLYAYACCYNLLAGVHVTGQLTSCKIYASLTAKCVTSDWIPFYFSKLRAYAVFASAVADKVLAPRTSEACPESKDTMVLNMYNIFNLQNRHCE